MLARYIVRTGVADVTIDEIEVQSEDEATSLLGTYLVWVRDLEWFDAPFSILVEFPNHAEM